MGFIGEHLKTIIPIHATIANQPMPDSTYEACDGHSTSTTNDITPGTAYATPDTRNKFLHGADRTLAPGATGSSSDAAGVAGGAAPAGSPGPRGTAGSMSHAISATDMPAHTHQINVTAATGHDHGTTAAASSNAGHAHASASAAFTWQSGYNSQAIWTSANSLGLAIYIQAVGGTDSQTQAAHTLATPNTTGDHSHTVTIAAAGSGTAADIRPGHVGLVHVMKVWY
jgi:hypothetical protein